MPTFREDLHTGHKVPLVETDDLMDGSVTASKIARKAIQWWHIACNAIRNCHISDKAVDNRTMDDDSVDERVLVDGLVERIMQPAIDDLQDQINSLKAGGNTVDVILTPSTAYIGVENNVTIKVSASSKASVIVISKGGVELGRATDSYYLEVEDTVTPTVGTDKIEYDVLAIVSGIEFEKRATLNVVQQDVAISWSTDNAWVYITATDLTDLPVLDKKGLVGTFKYYALDPETGAASDVATFQNDESYTSLRFEKAGNAVIKATYTDPNGEYKSQEATYRLEVRKAVLTKFRWEDPNGSVMYPYTVYTVYKDASDTQWPTLVCDPQKTVVYSCYPAGTSAIAIDSVTGEISVYGTVDAVHIKAEFMGDDNYAYASAEYTLTVQEQQAEVYWEISINGGAYVRGNSFEYKVLDYPAPRARLVYPSTASVEFKLYTLNGTTPILPGQWPTGLIVSETTDVQTGNITALVTFPDRLKAQGITENYKLRASSGSSDVATLTFSYTASDRNFVWNPPTTSPVYMGALVDNVYKIPSSQLPVISATRYTNQVDGFRLSADSSAYASRVRVTAINLTAYTYKVEVIGEVTETEGITVGIEAYANSSTQFKARTQTYQLTILPPTTYDYYVAWTNTANIDIYDAMQPADVVALNPVGIVAATYNPYTRKFNSDNTFFLLYKANAAPYVEFISNNHPQSVDLVNDNFWIDSHNVYKGDVTIEGTTFKVYSTRLADGYNTDDSMKVNMLRPQI